MAVNYGLEIVSFVNPKPIKMIPTRAPVFKQKL